MNIKISLSIFDNRIAPVFDVACQALLVDIKSGVACEELLVTMPKDSAEAKVLKLAELGVKTLICGAISKPALLLAQAHDIRVTGFVSGEMRQVLQAFKNGSLHGSEFNMPGCRRMGRCGGGHGHRKRGFSEQIG